jgi:hypothetical protein
MENNDDFAGLYFLNCIRAMPIFPLSERNPSKRYSLKPLAQGRRAKEKEEDTAPVSDETIMGYIAVSSMMMEEEISDEFESESMTKKVKAA